MPVPQRMAPLASVPKDQLLIHEVYASVQGESTFQGEPCVFVRTTACHLRCSYCDTEHAFYEGTVRTVDDVLQDVLARGLPLVEVTGGEPLLQPAVHALMRRLCDAGKTVLLETSGGVSTRDVDERVHIILDVKTPSSGEAERNVWANLERLRPHDEVKFVIGSREDFRWSVEKLREHDIARRCTVLFSPVTPGMEPRELAELVVAERLPVRFQVQLHKVLWGDKRGV
ncbi:MAG: radical SAM protein [Myxococcota bacterium]